MTEEKRKQYAELYISCCTDFLLGKITAEHWENMMELFIQNIKQEI
jgi:hypothetical protein